MQRSRRFTAVVLISGATFLLGYVIWATRGTWRGYSLLRDARTAETDIRQVARAEEQCREERGHYAPAREHCDALAVAVSRVENDGFRVQIQASDSEYSVRITPSSKERLISLYTDQTGEIRRGTRSRPATSDSPPLRSR
jgi:hypothetical protein